MEVKKLSAVVAAIVLAALCACPARADDSLPGANTLKGLHGVQVVIEDVAKDLSADGVTQDLLQSKVEKQLKAAGITVYDDDAWKADSAHPYLYIRVNSIKSDDTKYYAYSLDVELHQMVTLVQNQDITTLGNTWETGSFGIVSVGNASRIADSVTHQVASFISDFNGQNSASSSQKAPVRRPTRVASR